MKQSKKLSYMERKIVEKNGLDATIWRRLKVTAEALWIINPETNEIKQIPTGGVK